MAESMWQRTAHVGKNRRDDFRSLCREATVIDILSPITRHNVQVRVLDVSSSGLMLALGFPVVPGTLLRIKMTDAAAEGEVRYCTREGDEYRVGVRIEEIFSKNSES